MFPDKVILKVRHVFSGEEVFLRGLYELVTAENQHRICRNVFGGQQPHQSMCFNYFIKFMFTNWRKLVQGNLRWWYKTGWFHKSAEYIRKKLGLPENNVAFFIDCNCLPTSVIGGGPAEDGANSMRWDKTIQQAFYNGWKSIHGLKHQTLDNCLMTCDIAGPGSLRRNDMNVLNESGIEEELEEVQEEEEDELLKYDAMGDSAYLQQRHIRSYWKVSTMVNLSDEQKAAFKFWNARMKKVRISIEWNYGQTASLFTYVDARKTKLKLLKNPKAVSSVYIVATLFRNFHTALYGSQTSRYFEVDIPYDFLESYINQV